MELDIYIPSLNLAIEYQGNQHYQYNQFFATNQENDQNNFNFDKDGDIDSTNIENNEYGRYKNDLEKKEASEDIGLSLIEIPYWWNGDKNSLISTIYKNRPDIFENTGNLTKIINEEKIPEFRRIRKKNK